MTSTAIPLKPLDLIEVQAWLDALPGSNHNRFEENNWQFEDQRGRLIGIDFDDLLNMDEKYPSWPLVHKVDWVSLTKRMWIMLASKATPDSYSLRLQGVKLFWAAMAHHQFTRLTRDDIGVVLEFLLRHRWRAGEASKDPAIKSYSNFAEVVKFQHWKRAFVELGLDWVDRDLTESFVRKQLQQTIPALTGNEVSYRDWIEGGSFNRLTLDYGRFYVEHCLSFFEQYYPLAFALVSTVRSAAGLAASLGYNLRDVSQVLALNLQGSSADDLKRRWPDWSFSILSRVHEHGIQHFKASYKQARFEASLLKSETLEGFVVACGLETSPENVDRMRVILWDWVRRKNKKETRSQLRECSTRVPWAVFEEQLSIVKEFCDSQPLPVLSVDYYQSIGLTRDPNSGRDASYHRQLINRVAKAGLTNVVALTGWRKSEYGFPISSIKRRENNDRLDQYAFPWRYQIDWYVYKTSGRVRELREVTFSTVLIAERLQSLNGANDEVPCLYGFSKFNHKIFDSGERVSFAVRTLWSHFVHHYPGFKQLDDWSAWSALTNSQKAGAALTAVEQHELTRLLAQRTDEGWASLSIDVNLKEAWRRAREEWPRVELLFLRRNTREKKDWLIRYRARTLRADWTAELDAHLPEDIKDWIHSLSETELRNSSVSKRVTNCLMESALYPSPHAFRHMWAEAVYRRFDGDAGWMIRSQFKHISKSMWLDYIRDKDNRLGHERAKAQVVSSLVHNYLRHRGKGYAGELHVWLRRLFNRTRVLSPREQEQLAEHLASVEIENIKANPWGYCLLKRRTRDKAKCAEMGEPMRHNASPDVCLGCVHNLMQSESVEWALLHAAAHVDALKNPVVPQIFKASSYELVKNVARHIRTLDPGHEALPELRETMSDYQSSRNV